ncbi:MAG TPA: hypothetical protein VHX61_15815 [Rhizomicrobium sp.]|jgi:hypothetical protein|nr:hypothetical protein [Rhizomicrobium sp.]
MRWFAGVALSLSAALWGSLLAGAAAASTMGSLAPHDSTAATSAQEQWIAEPLTNCRALDSDFDAGDSITWQGRCSEGMVSGMGTLAFLNKGRPVETITGTFGEGVLMPGHVSAEWSDGSKYEGEQAGSQFDGIGVFTTAIGDRISGEWKSGALNGKASVVWANGDRYDGAWKNGKSDGQGTEVWANGDRYEGLWNDGKPVGQNEATAASGPPVGATPPPGVVPVAAPPTFPPPVVAPSARPLQAASSVLLIAPTSDAAGDAGGPLLSLHDFLGQTLVAVDGATIALDQTDGGFARTITLSSGVSEQTSFAFLNERIGTVSTRSTTIGLFRRSGDGMEIDYTDGEIETMKPDSAGGLLQTAHGPDGELSCTAWHPPGHVFSQEERRAAVQEYAARLGVAAPTAGRGHHMSHPAAHSCGGAYLINVADTAASAADGPGTNDQVPSSDRMAAPPLEQSQKPQAAPGNGSRRLQAIPVRTSAVHLIDAPYEAAPQPSVQNAKFTLDTVPPPPLPSGAPAAATAPPADASTCLSVVSNGEYWGFQNRCANAVQFVYCEMGDANPLTSCRSTGVSGSVAANGFGALISDRSLSEQGVKHDFRWTACDGGAGEVVPHLDRVDPPSGRCLRTVPAANSGAANRNPAGS